MLESGLRTKDQPVEDEGGLHNESSSSGNTGQRSSVISGNANTTLEVNFAALDQYIYSLTQVMVDNVCLHDARVQAIIAEKDAFDKETDTASVTDGKSEVDKQSESGISKGAQS